MDLLQILNLEGFDYRSKKVKLIRHTREGGVDIEELYKKGLLTDYQGVQTNDVFGDCDIVLSFIATENTKAKFVGAFEILGKSTVGQVAGERALMNLGIEGFYKDTQVYYFQKEISLLAEYKDRLIIEWGKAAVKWCQNLSAKRIIELLPEGYVLGFPGFDNVIIDYNELKRIINNADANREWHRMLSSVAGVYLILDTETGMQYVGSASGKEGILGRWKQYATDGHGGNMLLKKLLDANPLQYTKFQYSILRTLPQTLTNSEVIAVETIYKKKLGSRAFGLNSN